MSRRREAAFVDETKITAVGGDGGNGCMSFRREKFVPRGGPNGGDGGHGGSVILVADEGVSSLLAFRYKSLFRAERGRHGEGSNKTGRSGSPLIVRVPVGTLVSEESGVLFPVDLSTPGDRFTAAQGGRGGRGNARFATSVNRGPTRHDPGQPGEQRVYNLELKLLADVGLVGFPNVGKSTLISRVSASRPKIADYPFTTLTPNLGVVRCGDYRSFVMADIPGLIEGAHSGAGLGLRFLRHIDRCRILLHLVDLTSTEHEPLEGIRIIDRELLRYRKDLSNKPQFLVLTKSDAVQDLALVERVERHAKERGIPLFVISSVTGEGIEKLVRAADDALQKLDAPRPIPPAAGSGSPNP